MTLFVTMFHSFIGKEIIPTSLTILTFQEIRNSIPYVPKIEFQKRISLTIRIKAIRSHIGPMKHSYIKKFLSLYNFLN